MFSGTSHHILDLAEHCISLENAERPEVLWLKDKYERFQMKYHLKSKKETDIFLFKLMYERPPKNSTEHLKIRYWRTGQHVPGNRAQCILFGKALELSEEEMHYLVQNYYDRSFDVFDHVDSENTLPDERRRLLDELTSAYLERISLEERKKYKVTSEDIKRNLRHLYFTDAFHYIHNSSSINPSVLLKHISSTHYDSEFSRQIKLIGEVPRKTMIRHLIILNMPELTLEKINRQLDFLGYLPLCEEHTLVSGEHLDWLLIQLIEKYEKNRSVMPPEICSDWFQDACRTLDYFFYKEGHPHLRFMYFKALDL